MQPALHISASHRASVTVAPQILLGLNVSTSEPLYVSCQWEDMDLQLAARILDNLAAAGYKVGHSFCTEESIDLKALYLELPCA